MTEKILEVKDLHTSFYTYQGEVKAIRGINFDVEKGKALGIVGESGSGKSVTMLSVMRLLDESGKVKSGTIKFKGENLQAKKEYEMLKIRGNALAMIFQDPLSSLNPVFTIGDQIIEMLQAHKKISNKEAREKAIELLKQVEIPSPEKRIDQYPHEMSGGMLQRCMIAMALSCDPDLLIADEPTTALDVTIQAQIIDLLKNLMVKTNAGIIMITHDLGVVADICDKIIVMYGGLIMESGECDDIFYNPKHPYTIGLLGSVPSVDLNREKRLVTIPGTPPDLLNPPEGCPFASRCNKAMKICIRSCPPVTHIDDNHSVMCWLHNEEFIKQTQKVDSL